MVRAVVSPPYRATTLAVISLVSLIAFEAMAVATAMPVAARALDGVAFYGVAFGATLATAVVGMVISGEWCDRRGPSGPMSLGVSLMVLGLFVAGTAESIYMLILGRALQGVGFGMIQVAIYVMIGRRYPTHLHPTMLAALSTAWVLPSIIGPALAGLITIELGWRWVFLGVPLVAAPAIVTVLAQSRRPEIEGQPESERVATGRLGQITWALAAALGIGLLHLGGHNLDATGIAITVVALVTIGVAGIRILPPGTGRFGRGLPTVFALRGIAAAAFFSTEVFIPLLLIREHGLSPLVAGLALTAGSLGWTAGAWVQARISDRFPAGQRLQVAFGMMAAGIAISASAIIPGVPWIIATGGWVLAGLGMGNVFPGLAVLMLEYSPRSQQGTNSAALQLSDALATATTFAVSGAAFAALIGTQPAAAYTTVIGFATLLALLGSSTSWRVQRKTPVPEL